MNLYRQEIIEHMRSPRNFGKLTKPQLRVEADNPLCGDHVQLELNVDDRDVITDLRFQGSGCAITIASSSMFTEAIRGRRLAEIAQLSQKQALDLIGIEVTPARMTCATVILAAVKNAAQKLDEKAEKG